MRIRITSIAVSVVFFLLSAPRSTHAQNWGSASGRITEAQSSIPIPGVSVTVDGTNFGTASRDDGRYTLRLPVGRYLLKFSAIGYESRRDSVHIRSDESLTLNIALAEATLPLDEVTVEEARSIQAGLYTLDPETIQNIPMPVKDVLRSLKVLPGVVSNNELSNQYSVRGGGFNENLIFINDFEVFLPFRPRSGEQEGLSLLNGDMADKVTFYAGGFPVRYGGKLSSAVDVEYRRPNRTGEPFNGTAFVSLLDLGITASSSFLNQRAGAVVSFRKARPSRFFATQELKGNYQPDYTDFQAQLTYSLSDGDELEVLGIVADHSFSLDPRSRRTFFGTISQNASLAPSNLQALFTQFDDRSFEDDGYQTYFGAFRLSNRVSSRLRVSHSLAFFETVESEELFISGSSILFQVDPGEGNAEAGEGLFPIGLSKQEDAADNRVAVTTLTADGRYKYTTGNHAAETGWSARRLTFNDRLDEKSVIIGRSLEGDIVRIVADSLRDSAELNSWQLSFYADDSVDLLRNSPGKVVLTGGVRTDYFEFTNDWTFSPRLSITYQRDRLTSYFGSLGIYHQVPTYRELRGKPKVGETILGALNTDLRSQRSLQAIVGAEYFLVSSRFHLRGEAYYKRLTDIISYDIENVRVAYSGDNDTDGYAYGFDLQLRGEFVPGLESWVNYGFLVAREVFKPEFQTEFNQGSVPRPTDQRHTLSIFIQDYIPNDPTWKIHMRTLFGSGLPYTPPVPGKQIGNVILQAPGPRHSARYPRYFRFDMGVTKHIIATPKNASRPVVIELTGEILNIFDMTNTVNFSWTPDASGIWTRIPTRLTPRTVNVRVRVTY